MEREFAVFFVCPRQWRAEEQRFADALHKKQLSRGNWRVLWCAWRVRDELREGSLCRPWTCAQKAHPVIHPPDRLQVQTSHGLKALLKSGGFYTVDKWSCVVIDGDNHFDGSAECSRQRCGPFALSKTKAKLNGDK